MQESFHNQEATEEYDELVERFERGLTSPGKGNKALGKGIFYLRGAKGTRVFIRKVEGNVYENLGIANKSNENAVLNYLKRLYGIR
jgi:hypothetical protein